MTWSDLARWSGQEQRVFLEWGYEYEVYADAEGERVEAKLRERHSRSRLRAFRCPVKRIAIS